MKIYSKILSLLFVPILGLFFGCSEKPSGEGGDSEASFAYVTNGVDPFWDLCAAGVRIAEKEFGVSCEILMPPKGVVDQKRMMETLLAKGISGIAVSPVDAENQTPFLNEVSENTILITNDSDAPKSKRLVFIGTNNYKAGRALGGLVKKALPAGGEVMLFVGRLEQLNARQRRQGVIDELLGRPAQSVEQVKYDPVDATNLTSEDLKYTVLDTRTDNFDKARAKSNAEDSIAKYRDLKCMVGLFAYNSPSCIDAVKEADKLGTIKICGFDEQDALLKAIVDGHAYGTISQQPWEYGYESIKMLKNIWDGIQPSTTYQEVSFLEVTKENVDEFWAKKKEMAELGKAQ
jgi:ribose transport system substrate-binding protein